MGRWNFLSWTAGIVSTSLFSLQRWTPTVSVQRQRGNGVYRHWKHTHTHTFQPPPLKEILLNEPPVELSEPRWTKERGEEDTGGYGSCWKQLAPVWSEGIWRVPSSSPSAQSFLQTWDQPEAGWRSKKKNSVTWQVCFKVRGGGHTHKSPKDSFNPTMFQLITVKSLRHMDSLNENVMFWNARRAKV